ncbi:hypothetical protein [Bradyrhizobium elkanii]|uniref:hypothetical protein n=1 Tax=Bradyrhizobium elkanii TaxID=29448 RepID=UPI0035154ED6
MSRTKETKKRRTSQTRCARRSLVELTAAASRAVDDGIFVLSGGAAASNPRWEHTGANTSDQTILARQATAPSSLCGAELLDSDTIIEMVVEFSNDDQDRASENIKAGLDIALDRAKDLADTRVEGEAASKVGPILENAFLDRS